MNLSYGISMLAALGLTAPAIAEPVALGDAELARVSAGAYEVSPEPAAGIILGHASAGRLHATSTLMLEAEAQSGVKAVTIVNSANSSVATASNVWRHLPVAGGVAADISSVQANVMQQAHAGGATLTDWQSHAASRVSTVTETLDTAFTGRIIPTQLESDGLADTTLNLSHGVALAGEASVDAGGFGFDIGSDSVSELTKTSTTTTTTSFTLKFWRFSKTWTHTTSSTSETSTKFEDSAQESRSWAPKSDSFQGTGCLIWLGNCESAGHDTQSTQRAETVLQPISVQGASGGGIVLAAGELDDTVDSQVQLHGQAQRGISAVHAVNAAGSLVANGLNLSSHRSAASMFSMHLQQSNLLAQRP